MTKYFPASLLLAALALVAACNKPSPFGADLLDDQLADYAFSDSVSLRCSIVREDSVLTSDRTLTADFFLCGQLNDPIFGPSQAEVFSLLQLDNLNPGFKTTDVLDSIELILRYDATGVYGDTTQPVSMHVYRLTDPLRWDKDYYSNQSLNAAEEIGSLDFTPKPRTLVANPFDTDTAATKYAYVKVPLSAAFGQSLLGIDSLNMVNDTLFWEQLKGLKISVNSASTPGAMLSFDLNDGVSRIRLYYSRDTNNLTFDYLFAANKFNHYTHDYSGTVAGQQIGQINPDRLYMQGMSGLKMKLEFPYADRLDNIAVNKAELVLTVADVPGDPVSLAPSGQMVATELRGDTIFVLVSDVLYSLGPTFGSGFNAFGGQPEVEVINGVRVNRYRLTLTQRFQDMVDDTSGDLGKKTLYLNVYSQRASAMRSVLYGPASTTYPPKLELKYTRIQ